VEELGQGWRWGWQRAKGTKGGERSSPYLADLLEGQG